MMKLFTVSIFILTLLSGTAYAVQMYKYKDENGKWVFTDKKPKTEQKVDEVQYQGNKKAAPEPKAFTRRTETGYELVVDNPYYAPIEIEVSSTVFGNSKHLEVIEAHSSKVLYQGREKIPPFRYRWLIGDPAAREEHYRYTFPVFSKFSHRITQSFNGRFSHSRRPSIYAVDIATPVGTYISAAREGTVIWVKDDYHMGGSKRYFLDKANYVKVLHSDGTYAVYAHILLGSALVKPGDKVAVGESLARAGSSGYSTGPHLHFVIRKNTGFKPVSIPFKFVDNSGKSFTPRAGMMVNGVR